MRRLTDSGWRRVRVVTDHGWLLLPGGLPKVDLAPYLVETKWARCAVVKGQPDLNVPVSSWRWNAEVKIASPPGIVTFRAGETYAHGGVSQQKCVVPELIVERGASATLVRKVAVPPGSSAMVHLPCRDAESIRESGAPLPPSGVLRMTGFHQGVALVEIASGTDEFTFRQR